MAGITLLPVFLLFSPVYNGAVCVAWHIQYTFPLANTGMSSVQTYPPTELRGNLASAEGRAQSASGGFMMRHHDLNGYGGHREKKSTQEEQDEEDEEARKQAMRNLVNSWQERLQLISVITTFFATTEAAMLVNTKPGSSLEWENNALKVANAGLLGSLILHVYASVLSFLGAFLLISYKLREARREEMIVEGATIVTSPLGRSAIEDLERDAAGQRLPRASNDEQSTPRRSANYGTATPPSERHSLHLVKAPVFSANPHIEQVELFASNISSHRILSRTHAVCVSLAVAGFALAFIGILSYSWALQPKSVSIFASVCLGFSLLTVFAFCT